MIIQTLLIFSVFVIDHMRPAFAALEMTRFRSMFFARMRQAIAKRPLHRYSAPATVNPVAGRGNPISKRRTSAPKTIADAFFASAMTLYGGCAWAGFGLAGFLLPRFSTPRTVRLQSCGNDSGGSPAKGEPPMTQRHILTPNPSKARAAAHRAMAIAALRADSSLSVRLSRYNDHMAKAVEVVEVLA